jgi:hypothetical protein
MRANDFVTPRNTIEATELEVIAEITFHQPEGYQAYKKKRSCNHCAETKRLERRHPAVNEHVSKAYYQCSDRVEFVRCPIAIGNQLNWIKNRRQPKHDCHGGINNVVCVA